MNEPAKHVLDGADFGPRGQDGTLDHEHGQSQYARRDQLGHCPRAPGIFGYDEVDRLLPHQRQIACDAKRSAVDHDVMIGQSDRPIGLIDETQQIAMLRLRGECIDMHAAERKHHAPTRSSQRSDGRVDIADALPCVAVLRRPGRPCDSKMRDTGLRRRRKRMAAHLRGEGMRGIDQMGYSVSTKIAHEAIDATKPADPHGHRLQLRVRDAAGIAEHGRDTASRKSGRECTGFGRAAKDQDGRHG